MEEFDFAVIGSGSGLEVANVAANQGQSVAVVEKGPLGGTCLNRGCIPSKMLLYHADVLDAVENAGEFHIDASVDDVAFEDIVREVNEEVQGNAESIRRGLRSSDRHTLYEAEGRFVDDHTFEIVGSEDDGTRFHAETVLIAAGTRPTVPPVDGIEDVEYVTSTEMLQLETPPDHLVVIGGGYIAAELGHFFGTFGSDVSIVGRRPALLPQADEEVAEAFTDRFADRFDVYTGYEATSVSQSGEEITVEAREYEYGDEGGGEGGSGEGGSGEGGSGEGGSGEGGNGGDDGDSSDDGGVVEGGESVSITGDELLVAAGRRPNTDLLNLDVTGVQTDDEGFVATDGYLQTDVEGVWALGDIVGEYLLKHSANHEARAVARNIFGPEMTPVDYSAMPFAVFASPEVAGVGALEEELREAGREYATSTYQYEDTARGDAMHAKGFVKVVIDPEAEILGCHIIGPDASTLIQEVVVAMKAGTGSVQDIRESVHIHPALPEVVQRAFTGQFSHPGHEHHHH